MSSFSVSRSLAIIHHTKTAFLHFYKSNSKSESESSFFPRTFLGAFAFVWVLADGRRDDDTSSSRSSMSELSESSSFGGLRTCGMIAPARMRTASSSAQ